MIKRLYWRKLVIHFLNAKCKESLLNFFKIMIIIKILRNIDFKIPFLVFIKIRGRNGLFITLVSKVL